MRASGRQNNEKPLSKEEIDALARKFLTTELGLGIESAGIDLIRDDIRSNYENSHKMFVGQAKSNDDREVTLMGRAVYWPVGDPASGQFVHAREKNMVAKQVRLYSNSWQSYLGAIESLPTWHYWQDKEWNARAESKAAQDVEGMIETLTGYAINDPGGFRAHVDVAEFEKFRDPIMEILEEWNHLMLKLPPVDPARKETWEPAMNWDRNFGHPYHFSLTRERWDTVDWLNFRDWILAASVLMDDKIEEFAETSPSTVPNANEPIYTMFTRRPDRVIHGIRGLLKPHGAMCTSIFTPTLRNHDISWISVEQMQLEASEALADASCISADDLKKFDKSLHHRWFTLIYECVKESNFLKHAPKMRAVVLLLLYELTRKTYLRVHSSWLMEMLGGLPSGHGLTQWIGSLIHLVLYRFWRDKYSMEPKWQKVLSDDGIQIYDDFSPEEMAKLHLLMADDLKVIGMELHPDKTKIADPTIEVYIGQLNGEQMYMHDSTFFLKRNLQRDSMLSHGNSGGVYKAILETERNPTDKAISEAALRQHLIGIEEMTLGGGPPRAIYDLARIVDVIASCGQGNPLVEHQLRFVQNGWSGFSKRGRRILADQLDDSWRGGSTTYAGGTLDSGLGRRWAVEALLDDSDGYKVWDELVFEG